ncbi:MAG: 50S ribosomal protein L9 [Spirochaetaceae bacterium]|nr:50S ribosomal protein L9 [Spirochaetaceae bacterium]
MKVILNKDISPLGEEGDIRDVARGYARNFLLPQGIAFRYTERAARLFESRKEEIAERKKRKRDDALSVKERLEALELFVTMPAGANGKLYGAVTSQTLMDELEKQGFSVERKRIEIPGNSIKSTGKYKFTVKLYGNTTAELFISIAAQEIKAVSKEPPAKDKRRHTGERRTENTSVTGEAPGESAGTASVPEAEAAVAEQATVPEAAE